MSFLSYIYHGKYRKIVVTIWRNDLQVCHLLQQKEKNKFNPTHIFYWTFDTLKFICLNIENDKILKF